MSENTADRDGSECTIGERLRYAASPDQNGWRVQLSPLMLEADAEITRLSTALAAAERTIAARDNEIKRWNESRDIFAGQTVELKSALLTEQAKCAVLSGQVRKLIDRLSIDPADCAYNVTADGEAIDEAEAALRDTSAFAGALLNVARVAEGAVDEFVGAEDGEYPGIERLNDALAALRSPPTTEKETR